MHFERWSGALTFLVAALFGGSAHADCWNDLNALPSDTSATDKVNAVLACAVEQGVELGRLRTAIDNAEQASLAAGLARDAAVAAVADIAETAGQIDLVRQLLERQNNPWIVEERSLTELVGDVLQQNQQRVPFLDSDVGRYEFAIQRNGDFRRLTFSTWNGGMRVMTDAYWRGDHPIYRDGGQFFALGGSFWVLETDDERDPCPDPAHLLHYYYEYQADGVRIRSGNGCVPEGGPLFRRDRIIASPER